jgi:hypothetical protein
MNGQAMPQKVEADKNAVTDNPGLSHTLMTTATLLKSH